MRGMAVVMMVIYHFLYDLYYFRGTDSIFANPFWFYFQRTTATLFIALYRCCYPAFLSILALGRAQYRTRQCTRGRWCLVTTVSICSPMVVSVLARAGAGEPYLRRFLSTRAMVWCRTDRHWYRQLVLYLGSPTLLAA
jgi:hypothetical protein